MNATTIINQVGTGYLADRSDAVILMFASSFLSGVVTITLWGLSKDLILLLFYGVFYGLFAGGFSVLYCRFATSLTDNQPTQTWLYSMFESQRGLLIVVGGVLSGTLVGETTEFKKFGAGNYEKLILLVGVSLITSSLGD